MRPSIQLMPFLKDLIPGGLIFASVAVWLGCQQALTTLFIGSTYWLVIGLFLTVIIGVSYLLWTRTISPFVPAVFATYLRTSARLFTILNAGLIISVFAVPHLFNLRQYYTSDLYSLPARLGAFFCTYYSVIFVVELSSSLGFPPGLGLATRLNMLGHYKLQGSILAGSGGLLAAELAKPGLLPIPVLISTAIYISYAIHATFRIARATFTGYPISEGTTPSRCEFTPYAIHLTDVHLTAGKKRLEGGMGGSERLEAIVNAYTCKPPRLLLITGDLTDRGRPAEYQEAISLLEPLQKAGSEIFFAPGNHDLGTAYNATNHLIVMASPRYIGPTPHGTDGMLMQRYLEAAASLAPSLRDCAGQLLKKRLSGYREKELKFEYAISLAKERMQRDWSSKAVIFSEVTRIGNKCHPGGEPPNRWTAFIRYPGAYRGRFLSSWYAEKNWYSSFPLQADLTDDWTTVLILNSISPDLTIAGSAWGEIGTSQLVRLRKILKKKLTGRRRLRRFIILVHHPPFRWKDEPPPALRWADLQRWAFLGFSQTDVRTLLTILKEATDTGAEVVVLSGHRHGFKNYDGKSVGLATGRSGQLQKSIIAEGAALADPNTPVLALVINRNRIEVRTLEMEALSK